jgi:iron complex outermembrane receptor protein
MSSHRHPPAGVLRPAAIAALAALSASFSAAAQNRPEPITIDGDGAAVVDTVPVDPLRQPPPGDARLEGAEPTKLDSVEVTGSRLSRAAMEGALPVTTISREDILSSGKISVADALRASTFNTFGSYTSTAANSFQGQGLVSLRGLGSERTLVLLDGRRVATSPSVGGSGVDLNTIPLAAVEKIEVLSDGASAIYGSDAIGGVINIVLRKDFNGVEISAGAGTPTRRGGDEEDASIVAGISNGDARMLVGASYTKKEPIYLRDRSYTRSSLGPQNPDGTYNFSQAVGYSGFGNTILNADQSATLVPTDAACPADRGFVRMVDDLALFTGIENGAMCAFDFTNDAADKPRQETTSLFATFSYDLDYDLRFDTTLSYAQSESFGRAAPSPDFLFVPGTAPTNPYGEDVYVAHRFLPLGTRDNDNRAGVFGIISSIAKSFDDIEVELGARVNRYTFTELGNGFLLRSVAASAAASGAYNPFDPLNPVGPDDDTTLKSMVVTINRDALTEYREAFSTVRLPLFNLPAGRVDAAFGVEYRKERFYDIYDSQSEAGTIGGSAGNSSAGKRNAYAVYGEAAAPVVENVEVTLAARYDDYSDVGSAFSPKVSARWQVQPNLTLRASAGKGFRAPLLSELNANDKFSAESARDLVTCRSVGLPDADCPELQYDTFFKANSELEPEKSTQYGFGIAMQPLDWLDFTLDYYNITVEDSLTFYTVQSLIFRELLGQMLPDDTSIDRSGARPEFTTTSDNISEISTQGLDLLVNTRFNLGPWGLLLPNLSASYVLSYEEDDGVLPVRNQVGDQEKPEYRVTLELAWVYSDFTTTWSATHIASTSATLIPGDPNPLDLQQSGHVASNTVHDVQIKWDTPWNSTVSVGVRDLFDRGVSTNPFLTSPNYNQDLYDPTGRMPYARITQRF